MICSCSIPFHIKHHTTWSTFQVRSSIDFHLNVTTDRCFTLVMTESVHPLTRNYLLLLWKNSVHLWNNKSAPCICTSKQWCNFWLIQGYFTDLFKWACGLLRIQVDIWSLGNITRIEQRLQPLPCDEICYSLSQNFWLFGDKLNL